MWIAILTSSSDIEIISHWEAWVWLLKRIRITTKHICISIWFRRIFIFLAPTSIIRLQLCLYAVFSEFIIQQLLIVFLTLFLFLTTSYILINIIAIRFIIKYTPLVLVSTRRRSTLKQILQLFLLNLLPSRDERCSHVFFLEFLDLFDLFLEIQRGHFYCRYFVCIFNSAFVCNWIIIFKLKNYDHDY